MKALYSSSAFTANIFEYWKQKFEIANDDIFPLLSSLNDLLKLETQQIVNISYEKQNIIFPTAREHPCLDINFECIGSLKDIGFECKYREPFYNIYKGKSNSDWSKFDIYLKKPRNHWDGLSNLFEFASKKNDFRYLDVIQLIRHILGLNIKHQNNKDKYALIYLYCPSYFKDNSIYADEINQFNDIVKLDEIHFFSFTYYDLFITLDKNILKKDMAYLNYNMIRYL